MDDLDLCNGEDIPLEVGEERKKALTSFCVEHVHFSPLLLVWSQATKMRKWLYAKK